MNTVTTRDTASPRDIDGHGITQEPPAIELSGLTKTFKAANGRITAVDGIDLRINSGEIVALLGPNGAGKTTTLDMILGLISPTSGTCRVYGGTPRQAIAKGQISAMLQSAALLSDLSVRGTLDMVATQLAHPLPIDECLANADLTPIASRKVSKCSGGEQQRLRFAIALLTDPDLLVLDEPTAGMDVNSRRAFWATMHAEAERGRTIIFATHYLEEAEQFADRIVVIAEGKIIADGTTDEVRSLGGLREISIRWSDTNTDPAGVIDTIAGIDSWHWDHDRIVMTGADTDAIARELLTKTPATDLLITQVPLEEAFVGLTTAHRDDNNNHSATSSFEVTPA